MSPSKPRDRREYVRVSITLPSHPKLALIDNPNASWLYVVGLCWAAEHFTDGVLVPKAVERVAGVQHRWALTLIQQGLWHGSGHTCERCEQPPIGSVVVHDYLEHQRSRDEATKARTDASRAARKRWGTDAKGSAKGSAVRTAESNAEAEVEVEGESKTFLLTLVSRLAAGDAGAHTPPPAEVIASWQELAGPGVDLEDQAMRYLQRFGDRPASNERGAWLGWLRKADEHQAPTVPAPRPACSTRDCLDGWLPEDHDGRPVPCPSCRPHLQAVRDAS